MASTLNPADGAPPTDGGADVASMLNPADGAPLTTTWDAWAPASASSTSMSLSPLGNAEGAAMIAEPAAVSSAPIQRVYKPNPSLSHCTYPTKEMYKLVGLRLALLHPVRDTTFQLMRIAELTKKLRTVLSFDEGWELMYYKAKKVDRERARKTRGTKKDKISV
jgi:hypothetical protein